MVRTINCKYHIEKGNWDKLSPRWHLMRVIKIKKKQTTTYFRSLPEVSYSFTENANRNQWILMKFLSKVIH